MDSSKASTKLAQVRTLIQSSEPHFIYFYLNTYQQALYYSWIKDPDNSELLDKFEKRRQALEEQLAQFYPSNTADEQCQTIRTVARLCAGKVARELKVIIKDGGQQVDNSNVTENYFRVAIDDSLQADVQLNPTNIRWETKFSNLPKQDSHEQFTLKIWLLDGDGGKPVGNTLATVHEAQISGVNGFSLNITEPKSNRLIQIYVRWEIAPVQQQNFFPLLPLYWLQKFPIIIGQTGGEENESNKVWPLFAPAFRAYVGDWRRWPATPGLSSAVMHSLQKLYFLLNQKVLPDLFFHAVVKFCSETLDLNSSEDQQAIEQIAADPGFIRLLVNNLALFHGQMRRADKIKVLEWLARFTLPRDIQTIFFLLKYNEQMISNNEQVSGRNDRKVLLAVRCLNAVLKDHANQLDANLEIGDIILAYTDANGRVRDDQGELRKLRGIKRQIEGVIKGQPGMSPNGIVDRISQYLIAQTDEMDGRIGNALLRSC